MPKSLYKITISAMLLWTTTIVIAQADGASTNTQAGTINDPVITKSYFDQNIKQRVAEEIVKQSLTEDKVKQIIAAELGTAKLGQLQGNNTTNPSSTAGTASNELAIIKLEQGQTLYGSSGTELIVRTGKVTVMSSDENGIPDVTSGKDVSAGDPVELNHLLIVPREGRGIKADPKLKQDTYVMVRGSYLVLNADGSKASP